MAIATRNNGDMDMMMLPEHLLVDIASCLPFKEATKTSVLCKGWSNIWKSTKKIEFNELFFVKPGEINKETQRRVFLNFITPFLANYKGNKVDKFSLKVSNPQTCADIIQLSVSFATQHGVKELRLDFTEENNNNNLNNHASAALFQLPYHVYKHAPLEALELNACGFAMPDLVNFVGLKEVSLERIEVRVSTIKTLLSTCRELEKLSLKKCWNLAPFDMGGEELGLRSLVIDKCHFADADYLGFRTPNLTFLKYSGLVGAFQISVRPYVMQEAELDFTPMPRFDEYGDVFWELLHDLSCVYVLTVCSFLLQAIPSGEEPARIQCDMNVRHLIMKTQMHNQELFGFMFLLNSCACLEKLTIEIVQRRIYRSYVAPYPIDFKNFWKEHCMMYECLRRTLKVVEVNGFRGTNNEMGACSYMIRAGSVLEQLIINVMKKEGDPKLGMRYSNARWLLNNVPRGSKNLQISIL